SGDRVLDEDDLGIMQIVGDRLAAALALGRERQKLTERAALLDRLTTFATVLNTSPDAVSIAEHVTSGARVVIPADLVVMVTRDEASGAYLIAALEGSDKSLIGHVIQPGE